ncbi:hypothetical protein GUJ93_ZPchr0004g38267 [Zizania palustris]|uniref:Uncharacterized protein n=1 Tax=Zizania palustris TaxID=103762 RepID=A0A8J5T3Q6_ZIZPA|nr:hypothetical protein GUJ93_ZPchr0004g38267 [Zizania palustris]
MGLYTSILGLMGSHVFGVEGCEAEAEATRSRFAVPKPAAGRPAMSEVVVLVLTTKLTVRDDRSVHPPAGAGEAGVPVQRKSLEDKQHGGG